MEAFASLNDMLKLFRPLKPDEAERAEALLPVVSNILRTEAYKAGKDLDQMIACDPTGAYTDVVRSVTVDIVGRALMTPTDETPTTQFSQSALGYVVSGSYLVPGGGLFVKKDELHRLGFRRQKIGVIDFA